jgi:hypothetical protein
LRRSQFQDVEAADQEVFHIDEEKYQASYHGQQLGLTVVSFVC